jgi:uncharacterized protein
MSSTPIGKLIYGLRFLIILVWSFSAFWLWGWTYLRFTIWLSLLPDWIARIALMLTSQTGLVVVGCLVFGASSLLLWHWLPNKLSTSLAVLIPVLCLVGGLLFGVLDTQGTTSYVQEPASQGKVQVTREQLLIHMARFGASTELKALLQAGTSPNVADPLGRSALYWTKDAEIAKLLLQAGAKPDAKAVAEIAFWGRTDALKLLFEALPDNGKAIVAEIGQDALRSQYNARTSGEQDRAEIARMLLERGAQPIPDQDKLLRP